MKKHMKWKILAPTLFIYIASSVIILAVVLMTASKEIDALSNDFLMTSNELHSNNVQATVDTAINVSRYLQPPLLSDVKNGTGNREDTIGILTHVINRAPSVFGIYTLWEPNAFDGKDSEYVNKEGGDETGLFNIYIYRDDNGGLASEPLRDFDAADYYQLPKKTKGEIITDPIPYQLEDGTWLNLISLVVPIVSNGEFLGIVGTDVCVEALLLPLEGVSLYENGSMFAVDPNGVILYNIDPDKHGKDFYSYLHDSHSGDIRSKLASGQNFSQDLYMAGQKEKIRVSGIPVSVGDNYWVVGSLVPVSDISAATTRTLFTSVGVGLASIAAIIAFLVWIVTSYVSKPIKKLLTLVSEVSRGSLNINADRSRLSEDEIGRLTQDVYSLVDVIKAMIDDLSKITHEFNVNGDIEFRLESSKYSGSYKEMVDGINALVNALVNDILWVIDALAELSDGSFDIQNTELPGKKIVLYDQVDSLVSNLNGIHAEIASLAKNTAAGKLNIRADESKYRGGWAELLHELNVLVDSVSEPLSEIVLSLTEMEKGNFETRMTGDYHGAFDAVKHAVNLTEEITQSYINEIAEILRAISNGDLTVTINNEFIGSYSPIKEALNKILDSLNKTMGEINRAAGEVLSGSTHVSNSAIHLADGSSKQAFAVQDLTDSVESINEKTQLSAEYAADANEFARKSANHAMSSNNAMSAMTLSMANISASSSNISKVIKTIEDIALQTNLLALNAAVEAARAGGHGKGFSVVAEEVRSLAAKSQLSAKDTTVMIEDSNRNVKDGLDAAHETEDALETIVSDVKQVTEIISQISCMSQEQALSTSNIISRVNDISTVVQSNSATAEECAAASQELNSQAVTLKKLVSFFNFIKIPLSK